MSLDTEIRFHLTPRVHQLLELDCALLAWGSDLLWSGDAWSIRLAGTNRPPLKDPLTVRKNVYRVMLTRGRDGTVVFVPPDARMDGTYERLVGAGMRGLRGSGG